MRSVIVGAILCVVVGSGIAWGQTSPSALQEDVQSAKQAIISSDNMSKDQIVDAINEAVSVLTATSNNPCKATGGARFVVAADAICDNRSGKTFTRTFDPALFVKYDPLGTALYQGWYEISQYCASLAPSGTWELPSLKSMRILLDPAGEVPVSLQEWLIQIGFLNVAYFNQSYPTLGVFGLTFDLKDMFLYSTGFPHNDTYASSIVVNSIPHQAANGYLVSTQTLTGPQSNLRPWQTVRLCVKK